MPPLQWCDPNACRPTLSVSVGLKVQELRLNSLTMQCGQRPQAQTAGLACVLLHVAALPCMCRGNGSQPWSMMHLGRWPEPSRSAAQQSRPSGSAASTQVPVQPQPWTSAPSQVRLPGTSSAPRLAWVV